MRVQIPLEADQMLPFTIDLMCDPSVHSAPGVNKDNKLISCRMKEITSELFLSSYN